MSVLYSLCGYLSLFALMVGLAAIVFRVVIRRQYARRNKLTKLSAFLEFLVYFVMNYVAYTFMGSDWPAIHMNMGVVFIGSLVGFVGLVILGFSVSRLGWSSSLGQSSSWLRQEGLYRYSRNPQLIGYFVFIIGVAILWPAWYHVYWLIQILIVSHLMIMTEEEYLQSLYGETYDQYCRRVPRYLKRLA